MPMIVCPTVFMRKWKIQDVCSMFYFAAGNEKVVCKIEGKQSDGKLVALLLKENGELTCPKGWVRKKGDIPGTGSHHL